MRQPRLTPLATLCALGLAAAGPCLAQTAAPVSLRILAINDFHGYLRPPPGGIRITDPADATRKIMVPAGGAERLATVVKQLREGRLSMPDRQLKDPRPK